MTVTLPHLQSTMLAPIAQLRTLLPQLRDDEIELRNRVYASPTFLLSNGRILNWQECPSFLTTGVLCCKLAGVPLAVAVDSLPSLEPRLVDIESFFPSETCAALVEHALSPFLSLIEGMAGVGIECNEFRHTEPLHQIDDSAPFVQIGFVIQPHQQCVAVRGWMRARPQSWRSLDFSRVPTLPSKRHLGVPTILFVQLGSCRLTAEQLRRLDVADALRMTPRLTRDCKDLPVRLTDISGRFSATARLSGEHIILETTVNTHIETPPPSAIPTSQFDKGDPLADLECEVSFELGSMRMTVSEIAKLRSGQAMRLGRRLQEQPIRIMVSGRLIARGELAAVGDELVVVVTDTTRLADV